jgi:hypothetical protein
MRAEFKAHPLLESLLNTPDRIPVSRRLIIDDVSDDIVELEKYFQRAAVRTPLHIEFHDSGIIPVLGDDLEGYAGPICQFVEAVGWEPIGNDWHLTYRKTKRLGIMPTTGGSDGPTFEHSEDLEHCPLSDAPVGDRIRAHRALPDLLQEAGALARP